MIDLIAKIISIDSVDNLNIITLEFYDYQLEMLSLELDKDIVVGKKVILGIKPTNITIAKDFNSQISYENQLEAKIVSCELGKMLASIKLSIKDIIIESIITLNCYNKMNLEIDDKVVIMIKANQISLSSL